MAITKTLTRQRYIASGTVNETFEITFAFPDIEGVNLLLYQNGAIIETSNYSIDRRSDGSVFVKMLDTLPNQQANDPAVEPFLSENDVVNLVRKTEPTQLLQYRRGARFSASDLSDALDKNVLISQEVVSDTLARGAAPNFVQSGVELPDPYVGRIFYLTQLYGGYEQGVWLYNGLDWIDVGGGSGSGVIRLENFAEQYEITAQLAYLEADAEYKGQNYLKGLYIYNGSKWVLVNTGDLFSDANIQMFRNAILPNMIGYDIDEITRILTIKRVVGGDFQIRFPETFGSGGTVTPPQGVRFLQAEDGTFLATENNEFLEGA